MANLTDTKIKAAEKRGEELLVSELRATAARYDAATRKIIVDLANGCSYVFPASIVQDLNDAAAEDLARIDVDGAGFNLHWPRLDVDLYVPALVAGIFGTQRWMAGELARIAGSTRSDAKANAARNNGIKGGRPKKIA